MEADQDRLTATTKNAVIVDLDLYRANAGNKRTATAYQQMNFPFATLVIVVFFVLVLLARTR